MKGLFAETEFAKEIGLTAVNSINFVRIAAQAVYYFTATAALGRPATFVVPTEISAIFSRAKRRAAWGCRAAGDRHQPERHHGPRPQ